MPKRKQPETVPAEPFTVRHNCWYCGKECRQEIHYPKGSAAHPEGYTYVANSGSINLLNGNFAHESCQDQVKTPGYAKARTAYLAWLRRQEDRHIKYAKTHPLTATVTRNK
jgi:hypothetical protein